MKKFVCVRIKKQKSWSVKSQSTSSKRPSDVRGSWLHDMRLIRTPNANKELLNENRIACEETGWILQKLTPNTLKTSGCLDQDFIVKKAQALLKSKEIVPCMGQVLCTNLMLMVSPEFLRNGKSDGELNPEKVEKFISSSSEFLRKKFGDRLLCMVVHLDEQNPHISAYVVPLVEKFVKSRGRKKKSEHDKDKKSVMKWRLSCADLFTPDRYKVITGKDGTTQKMLLREGTCAQIQTEFAEALREVGLEVSRGVKRPPNQKGLKYETTKERYLRMVEPIREVMELSDEELRSWAIKTAPLAAEANRAKEERDYYQNAASFAQDQVKDLKRKAADFHRAIPLETVIFFLTGIDARTPVDSKNGEIKEEFHLPNGQRIGISDGNRFENLTPEIPFAGGNAKRVKGRGAIDAVVFITGWGYQEAVEWITDKLGRLDAMKAVGERASLEADSSSHNLERKSRVDHAEKMIDKIKTPDESRWPDVLETLTTTYRFDSKALEKLHAAGLIDGNVFGNLMFSKCRWNEQEDLWISGRIILDLKYPAVPILETGGPGLYMDNAIDAKAAIICTTPMDALAMRCDMNHASKNIIVIDQNLDEKSKGLVDKIIKNHSGNVSLADNYTTQGGKLMNWITSNFPEVARLPLPPGCKSWNHIAIIKEKKDQEALKSSPGMEK